MDSIKRALKNIFKRGKKGKQSKHNSDHYSRGSAETTPDHFLHQTPPAPPKDDDAPPRLPAIQSPSPLGETRNLPPSGPLASDEPVKPRGARLVDHDAVLGGARTDSLRLLEQDGQGGGDVSPGGMTARTADSRSSTAVSGIDDEGRPEPLSKLDGAADASKAAVPDAAVAAATPSGPRHTASVATHPNTKTKTTKRIDPAASIKRELEPTNRTAPLPPPTPKAQPPQASQYLIAHTNGASKPAAPRPVTVPAPSDEGKIAVLDEVPPPVKTAKAAPGMSATSGPLEDFPEGGGY